MILEHDFKKAMQSAGIETDAAILADGKLYRFHIKGDHAVSKNGWYVLYADDPPAGQFGCWKRGLSETWCAKEYQDMSGQEKVAYGSKMATMIWQKEEGRQRLQAECRKHCISLWDQAPHAKDNHPYLMAKQVKAYGLKWNRGALLVPVRDFDGILYGLQRIWRTGNGGKSFELGTAVKGHFHVIGTMARETAIVCEGYATGASIHQATGLTVVVAFDVGNLKPVAEVLKASFPGRQLIIAADNDQWTDGNPGITKSTEAAESVDGLLVVPSFTDISGKPTDFNDLYRAEGAEAVRLLFERQGVDCV